MHEFALITHYDFDPLTSLQLKEYVFYRLDCKLYDWQFWKLLSLRHLSDYLFIVFFFTYGFYSFVELLHLS